MLRAKWYYFLQQDYSVGCLLLLASILAIIAANTPLSDTYNLLLNTPFQIALGTASIKKPLLLWINDGLMALFFLLVGLEIKKEIIEGDLSSPAKMILPGIAAIGGMLVPALIYIAFNFNDAVGLRGWAIPAATDIAFAMGVFALLSKRVPPSLKIFLLALAIIDDLGAIIIIAFFYTNHLSTIALLIAGLLLLVLITFNLLGVRRLTPYMIIGSILWLCILKSGVHATLAGVLIAFTIPLNPSKKQKKLSDKLKAPQSHGPLSPLNRLEHLLINKVNYFILPIFAFANTGISISLDQLKALGNPIPLGIMFGLFFGKQLGVFSFSWFAIKMKLAALPQGASWRHLYGISTLCGIGFTMSFFISSLAFAHVNIDYILADRAGILIGSLLSAILGYWILRKPIKQTIH